MQELFSEIFHGCLYDSKSGEYAVIRIIGPMQHGMDSAIGELWSIGTGYAIALYTKHGIGYAVLLYTKHGTGYAIALYTKHGIGYAIALYTKHGIGYAVLGSIGHSGCKAQSRLPCVIR